MSITTHAAALAAYPWLGQPCPRMIGHALALIGTREAAGRADNPVILGWAKEAGVAGYAADQVPWCGLFMAVVAVRGGKAVPPAPLWARNWRKFGVPATGGAMLGDVLVFGRDGGGHVGLYVAEDAGAFHVLGGNQGDGVSIARIARPRLIGTRRPAYRTMPASVRAWHAGDALAARPLSTSEA